MKKSAAAPDKFLVLLLALFVVGGGLVFTSAAFGSLGKGVTNINSLMFNHLALGLGVGLILLIVTLSIPYHFFRKFAPHLFVASIIATAAVFIPHIGMAHGGGRRWILIAGQSFQPSEAMKIGVILISAAYFAGMHNKVNTIKYGLLGFLCIIAVPSLLLLAQPDMGTLGVVGIAAFSIYFAAGARWRDIALVIVIGILSLGVLALTRPYVRDRIVTFIRPASGQQAEGYQIRQSLIAIGSGGIAGRGFGQGVQKFTYLPEPMGDSIFAVIGEELGFIGCVVIIIAFLLFAIRGYAIAAAVRDPFAALLAVGISTYLASEAFINMASMLGLMPLTGIPLTFISHGGTAILLSLASAGILLNVSKSRSV